MKKRYIIIGLIAVIAAALCVWLFMAPQSLGNINHNSSEPETSASSVTFAGGAGDEIKLSLVSDVKSGALNITVYDSTGNAVKELDKATESVTFMTLDSSGIYTLTAEYTDFVGSFRIAAYKI